MQLLSPLASENAALLMPCKAPKKTSTLGTKGSAANTTASARIQSTKSYPTSWRHSKALWFQPKKLAPNLPYHQ
jgi:hypothetical protein